MKTSVKIFSEIIFISLLLISVHSYSQKSAWNSKLHSTKSFIENKGQFANINDKQVLFANFDNTEEYYFTNKGLIIKIDTVLNKKPLAKKILDVFKSEKEKNEVEKEYLKENSYYLFAEWQEINSDVKIETSEKTEGYYTFGLHNEMCNGYKKITYKNIYPNIDIEYTLPNDKAGIKYNLILHPGADVSTISLKYSGDVTEMIADNNGNIVIKNPLHNIIEHAPKSYYSDVSGDIASSYILKDNLITFFISNTNQDKTIIIDPWISGITGYTDPWGYDVDFDNDNNLYVYYNDIVGGVNGGLYVRKFSSIGALLWTHTVTSQIMYEGNFMIDRVANKVYISEGFNAGGATAYRLNLNGIADGFVSLQNGNYKEMWDLAFDYNNDKIIGVGGGTSTNLNGGIINPVTGAVSIANFTGLSPTDQDIACQAIDDQGNLFVVYAYAAGYMDNLISRINTTYNGNVWQVPHGMIGFNECMNHAPLFSCMGPGSNAFNGLAVNDDYLYYYDGGGLAAYNKVTGAQIAATSVGFSGTWYIPISQGGIAVDNCNNIYLGGPNSNILVYKFNGSSFSAPINMPLGWTGNQSVFDIKYDKVNQLLFVSGHSNVGVFNAPIECLVSIKGNLMVNNENIQVFPNPATDFTKIVWNISDKITIEILDITGKLVQVFENINTGELNVNTEKIEKGIYTIKLTDEKNQLKGTAKLIVE